MMFVILSILGLCLGSFAGAFVWRLRAQQLVIDKKQGEKVNEREYKSLHALTGRRVTKDRSQCLHCHYELRWYDLIPLVSWLSLKGKCRRCHKPIGYLEPLIELGVAVFFVASYLLWPVPLEGALTVAGFVLWLIAGVIMAMLFVYDTKWYLLPDRVNFSLIAIGVAVAVLTGLQAESLTVAVLSIAGSVGILSGIYLVLYLVSKGKWIGFGDIKLGLALGLLLSDWQLALLALFLANFIGCLIVLPLLATKRLTRTSRIPFGPLLIAGAIIAKLVGWMVLDFYAFALI